MCPCPPPSPSLGNLSQTLAEDQGAVVLALADPANTVLTGDPIRLLALFREQNEPMVLEAADEVRASACCGRSVYGPAPDRHCSLHPPSSYPRSRWSWSGTPTPLPRTSATTAWAASGPWLSTCLATVRNAATSLTSSALPRLRSLQSPSSHPTPFPGAAIDTDSVMLLALSQPNLLATDHLRIEMASDRDETDPRLVVPASEAEPIVVSARGEGLPTLDGIGNYVPLAWTPKDGCVVCKERKSRRQAAAASVAAEASLPAIHVAVVVGAISPFLSLTLRDFALQDYPSGRLTVTAVILPSDRQADYAAQWRAWASAHAGLAAAEPRLLSSSASLGAAVAAAADSAGDSHFLLHNSLARLTQPQALRHLASQQLHSVAPKLTRQGKYWSNFWGAASGLYAPQLGDTGYLRSADYFSLVLRERRGLWAAPLTFELVLYSPAAKRRVAHLCEASAAAAPTDLDFWRLQLGVAREIRLAGVLHHVDNTQDWGHLINPDGFDPTRLHPDLYLVAENPLEWEALYLNEEYPRYAEHGFIPECNDVFKVPMFSPAFSRQLIEECENYGRWSGGDNKDDRLSGGGWRGVAVQRESGEEGGGTATGRQKRAECEMRRYKAQVERP